jgi:hypothetical protein
MMNGLPKVQEIRSISKFSVSVITVIFEDQVNIYFARQIVNEKLQNAKSKLPTGVNTELGPIVSGMGEIFQYIVSGNGYSVTELKAIQDWEIKYRLKSVAGINEVNTWGGFNQEYQVTISPEKLIQHQLSLNEATDENLRTDLRRLSSIDKRGIFSPDSIFIDKNTKAEKLAKPTLRLTPSVSTGLEESELTNRLKLAIGIPVNKEQSSEKTIITDLFKKAKNLIKGSEAYGGLEVTYGSGSLEILTNLLSQELENHKLSHSDTTLNKSLTLELIGILQETPATVKDSLMSIL